jgi:voltage-gated sodium channel
VRLIVTGRGFFRDPWNVFDFIVVTLSLMPQTGPLSVLRALRILRVLRLVSAVPTLRRVVGGLIESMPGIGAIAFLLALVYYCFAVMATNLFGEDAPEAFGTMGRSAYTLFT